MTQRCAVTTSLELTAPAAGREIVPVRSMLHHPRAGLTAAAIVLVLGLVIAMTEGHPEYEAQAAIRVSPVFSKALSEDVELRFNSNSDYRDFVDQQVLDIDSYETAAAALDELGPERSLWQKSGQSDQRAAEMLMAALEVRAVPDTYLITVTLRGKRAQGLAKIVNAVAQTYLKRQQGQELFASDRRIQLLQRRKTQLEGQLESAIHRQSEIGQELGVSTFEEKFINPYDMELVRANEALDVARRARIEAEARVAALKSHQERIRELDVDPDAEQLVSNDRALDDLRGIFYQRKAALIVQLQGLGPFHPGRKPLEQQLREIDTKLDQFTGEALKRTRDALIGGRTNQSIEKMSEAESEVQRTTLAERALSAQAEALRGKVSEFASHYNEAIDLREQADRYRKQIDEVNDRIDFLTLESKAPGFVRLDSAARTPDLPIKGGRKKIAIIFVVLAAIVGIAVPVGIDHLDPRVLTAAELRKVLGFPALGHALGALSEGAFQVQSKRIALAFAREHRASGQASFVLTSAQSAAGVTTLVLDLAKELSDLGIQTVAVEANASHSDRRYAGAHSSKGLNDLVEEKSDVAAVLSKATATLPDRIAVGVEAGSHALWSPTKLAAAFEQIRRQFEIVLIDSPALFESPDAELLIGAAAAAILVVPAGLEETATVKSAAQFLEQIAPSVVGAVFNEGTRALRQPDAGRLLIRRFERAVHRLWREPA